MVLCGLKKSLEVINITNTTELRVLYDDILHTDENDNLNVFEDLINSMSISLEDRKKLLDVLEKRRIELKNNILKTEMKDNFSEFIKYISADK